MKEKTIFQGVATAIVTPMNENGVDYDAFGRLIDWQIEQGINGLVVAGTTGEGSTLSDEEHREVLAYAVKRINGRVPCIAGTGSNDTAYAIELTKYACSIGCDAMLVVTPYYNKATQKGLVKMFNAIADASTKPIIVYNIPSRTGVNIEPATFVELAKHPRIVAIKEASGNLSKMVEEFALLDGSLDIYSGNDDQIVPTLSMGGKGVISVLSNIMPKETVAMCDAFFAGDVATAAKMQCKYLPLIQALFCEVNPIPVKAALAAMGRMEGVIRLPLTEMEEDHQEKMVSIMRGFGLVD
ncbi:MAG: 4-hydroxy-tetrahydrodipicolinate synthase [Bulleidia sp.]|nr:4-hydroxy-tetrahydrodipicolinate synthase [Bulleidia sp.]